jgi:hypothetical protein
MELNVTVLFPDVLRCFLPIFATEIKNGLQINSGLKLALVDQYARRGLLISEKNKNIINR